jgi:pimeloyl-ACP methyl ester carboxylesterase
MRNLRTIFLAIGVFVLIFIIAGFSTFYVLNSRNSARPEALAALDSDDAITVQQVEGQDWYVFSPTTTSVDAGFIIYPGGFVDPRAYALLARDIAAAGYQVVLVPMPLDLAVLDFSAADKVVSTFPDISSWAIGGHSLGGAMAAQYIGGNPAAMDGLALWASYPAESTDLSPLSIQAVSIYGDADGVASMENVTDAASRLPPNTVFVPIPGGNHTQFGLYGEGLQRGDNPAGISREDQHAVVVESTIQMLDSIDR